MNAEDILKSFFGGNNAGPFGSAGSNFSSGGFQEAAQVEYMTFYFYHEGLIIIFLSLACIKFNLNN